MRRSYKMAILLVLGVILFLKNPPQEAAASAAGENPAAENGTAGKALTVSFNVNGGTGDAAPITVTYGGTYGGLPEVKRTNYVFQGWYTFASGGTRITENTKIIKPLSHTLYAHWRGEPRELTLDANGGSLKSTKVRVYYGSKFFNQLPIPARDNYKFDGWYTASDGGEKITVHSIFGKASKMTLYAHWTEKTVKVIFIAFNGEIYEKEVSDGKEYGELPEPEQENYIFGGWYKSEDYTDYEAEAITPETIVNETGRVRLFARWYFDKN